MRKAEEIDDYVNEGLEKLRSHFESQPAYGKPWVPDMLAIAEVLLRHAAENPLEGFQLPQFITQQAPAKPVKPA